MAKYVVDLGIFGVYPMKQHLHLFTASALVIFYLSACTTKTTDSIPNFSTVDPAVKSQISGFLDDYFALNNMLIEDSLTGAKVAAQKFSETAKAFNIEKLTPEQLDFYLVQSAGLKNSLDDLNRSGDIESARVELATISESMYAMVKAFHPNDTPLYYQYCPMARDNKGANWLSATKELVNPYMGQMMLACGRTQETIE